MSADFECRYYWARSKIDKEAFVAAKIISNGEVYWVTVGSAKRWSDEQVNVVATIEEEVEYYKTEW